MSSCKHARLSGQGVWLKRCSLKCSAWRRSLPVGGPALFRIFSAKFWRCGLKRQAVTRSPKKANPETVDVTATSCKERGIPSFEVLYSKKRIRGTKVCNTSPLGANPNFISFLNSKIETSFYKSSFRKQETLARDSLSCAVRSFPSCGRTMPRAEALAAEGNYTVNWNLLHEFTQDSCKSGSTSRKFLLEYKGLIFLSTACIKEELPFYLHQAFLCMSSSYLKMSRPAESLHYTCNSAQKKEYIYKSLFKGLWVCPYVSFLPAPESLNVTGLGAIDKEQSRLHLVSIVAWAEIDGLNSAWHGGYGKALELRVSFDAAINIKRPAHKLCVFMRPSCSEFEY